MRIFLSPAVHLMVIASQTQTSTIGSRQALGRQRSGSERRKEENYKE